MQFAPSQILLTAELRPLGLDLGLRFLRVCLLHVLLNFVLTYVHYTCLL